MCVMTNIKGLYTYDFDDLYNSTDIGDLKYKIIDFSQNSKENDINTKKLTDLFYFAVCENYLFLEKNVYIQVRVIPMREAFVTPY